MEAHMGSLGRIGASPQAPTLTTLQVMPPPGGAAAEPSPERRAQPPGSFNARSSEQDKHDCREDLGHLISVVKGFGAAKSSIAGPRKASKSARDGDPAQWPPLRACREGPLPFPPQLAPSRAQDHLVTTRREGQGSTGLNPQHLPSGVAPLCTFLHP